MRRRAATVAVALLVVVGMLVAACGGEEGGITTTTQPSSPTSQAESDTTTSSEDGGGGENPYTSDTWTADGVPDYASFDMTGEQILWADFGGTIHEDFANTYLDSFSELTGVEIIDASPFDYAQVRAQVESGNIQYDMIPGVDYVIQQGCGELYEEIPDEKFYRGLIREEVLASPCVIPHGTTVFLPFYHRETYQDNPPDSCDDFFDLEGYPGSRAVWNSSVGIPFEIALLADGVSPDAMYPIDFDRALAKWDTIRDGLEFYSPLGQAQEGMLNEQWDMLIANQAAGMRIVRADGEIAYEPVWECAVAQVQSIGILKGTPRLDAATALAGYATTPEPQAVGMMVRASSPVLEPEEIIVPDDLPEYMQDYLMYFNEDKMPLVFQDSTFWSENFEEAEQIFQQWQVG